MIGGRRGNGRHTPACRDRMEKWLEEMGDSRVERFRVRLGEWAEEKHRQQEDGREKEGIEGENPDDVDLETDDDALDLCLSIHAITQEWILDERLRAYLSPLDLESNAEDL